jgi:methylenetetrahydrofolate dehydrogenase (NADP+)/methenyltetrahydrofolate cyclohydrolase
MMVMEREYEEMKISKANIVSCKDYYHEKMYSLTKQISELKNTPTLVVIQIDDDIASSSYIKGKKKDCEEVGINFKHFKLDSAKNSQKSLCNILTAFSNDKLVHGIILQLPIPQKYNLDELLKCIDPGKDVDGFRKESKFVPCTPKGIVDWLEYNQYDFVGKDVTVLGRSKIVGKPLVDMLIDKGATVTCCNSHTSHIERYTLNSNLVISAIGKAQLLCCEIPRDAIVIDVGISRDINGKLCGDVNYEYVNKYVNNTYVTPVPRGVGLLTRLTLLENVLKAYKIQEKV